MWQGPRHSFPSLDCSPDLSPEAGFFIPSQTTSETHSSPLRSTYKLSVTTPTSQASKLRPSKARLAGRVLRNSSRFSSGPRPSGQGEQGWSWSLTCRDRSAWPGGTGAGGTAGGGRDRFVGHPNSWVRRPPAGRSSGVGCPAAQPLSDWQAGCTPLVNRAPAGRAGGHDRSSLSIGALSCHSRRLIG